MSRRRTHSFQLPTHPVHTSYSLAEVIRDTSRPSHVTLLLDGVESSALDLDDPAYLEFEYMQHISILVESRINPRQRPKERHPRILHLGGAGCALARSLGSRQSLHQTAVEIDAKLAQLVREWFPLPPSPFLKIRVSEARTMLESTTSVWDAIIRDAFFNRAVPEHLVTYETASTASHAITPAGAYIVNAVASAGPRRLNEDISAICASFEHVIAICDPAIFSGRRFGNVVVGGAHTAWDIPSIDRLVRSLPLPARVFGDEEIRKRALSAHPLRDSSIGWPPHSPEDHSSNEESAPA